MLDPSWVMAKDAEEDFDDASGWWCQWCPVGIAEVGFGDESWLQRTGQRHIAFDRGGVLHRDVSGTKSSSCSDNQTSLLE